MSNPDPWRVLRRHTAARIALGRVGDGLPTAELLQFQMAHARARDAVHMAFDAAGVAAAVRDAVPGLTVMQTASAAPDRATYLQRPDLGRRLAEGEAAHLREAAGEGPFDAVFIIGDGLSARAVHAHAAATLATAVAGLKAWRLAPVVVARQARVALGDPVAEALGAACSVMLVGERPGLSASDSLGAYLTWAPRTGRHDADRNCVSNIRPEGLDPARAGAKIAWLMRQARALGVSGVALKDDAPEAMTEEAPPATLEGRADRTS
ncbi:ethanolamine ammonia-lyase subunit EutC [Caenispirillum salinarum]|uniref:ethanolamine ammonia-lyase subunit EutC n=1 Tax=Caenispirillum salinarum TaxID=859058 RepID=UPI00384AA6F1